MHTDGNPASLTMGNLKPTDFCEQKFRKVERSLDEALERLRRDLDGMAVVDRCNRNGFDRTGFPHFLWEVDLERSTDPCPYVSRAAVKISYLQPLGAGDASEVRLASIAEKYMIGSLSFFKRTVPERVPVCGLAASVICDVSRALLDQADRMLRSEPAS